MKNLYLLIRFVLCWGLLQLHTGAQAQTGQAIDMDGVDDVLVIPSQGGMTEYTIQVRVLFKGSVSNRGIILLTHDGADRSFSHQIRTDASGHFMHYLYDQGDASHPGRTLLFAGTTVAVPNQWYNVTITAKTGGFARLYVNGVEEGNAEQVNAVWTGGTGFWVGSYGGNPSIPNLQVNYLEGQIDEVRIWNVELSASAIAQNSTCSISGSYPGLLHAYNFTYGTASGNNANLYFVPDITGNNGTAVFANAALNGPTSNYVAPAGTLSTVCSLSSVNLTSNANPIFNGSTMPSADNNTSFGVVVPGYTLSKTYTLQNTGTATSHISGVTLAGADAALFAVTAQPAAVLTPGASTSFTISFSPSGQGSKMATVHLASDAAGAPDFSFAIGGIGGTPLPVTLTSFEGIRRDKSNLLQWATSSEVGASAFVIERSANGVDFMELGRVAASGDASTARSYSFEDAQPLKGTNYYRLRLVDRDGRQSFSKIVSLRAADNSLVQVSILPNPVQDGAVVSISAARTGKLSFDLYNSMGQASGRYELRSDGNGVQFRLSRKGLPAGTYYYRLSDENGVLASGKLLFQ